MGYKKWLYRVCGLVAVSMTSSLPLQGTTYPVTKSSGGNSTTGTLGWAIGQANANPGSTVLFESSITDVTLSEAPPNVTADMRIESMNFVNVGHDLILNKSGITFSMSNVTFMSGVSVAEDASIPTGSSFTSVSELTYITVESAVFTIDGLVYVPATLDFDSGTENYIGGLTNYGTTTIYGIVYGDIGNNGTLNLCEGGSIVGSVGGAATTNVGCSLSTPVINGDFLAAPGAVVAFTLESGGISELTVTGDVTLEQNVTLQFKPSQGCYSNGREFSFLQVQGTFSGEFSSVDMGTLLLTPTISYTPHGAVLTVNRTPLANIVSGSNAWSVAKALDVVTEESLNAGDATLCNAIGEFMFASAKDISAFADQLQPALFKGLTISQENNMVKVQDALSYRMQDRLNQVHCTAVFTQQTKDQSANGCQKDEKRIHVWADGFGDILHQKKVYFAGSSQVGYQTKTGGVVTGVDGHFAKYFYVGVLGAYTASSTHYSQEAGKGSIDTGYGGLYFSALSDMFYANASVVGGWSHFTGHRNIYSVETTHRANNTHGGAQLLSHIDTGINLGWGSFTLRPFDSFDYIAQTEEGFTETGADLLSLKVQSSNAIMLRNELGLQFAGCFCMGSSRWTVAPKISWVREVRIKGSSYTAEFVGTEESFRVTGYFPDRSLVSPGLLISGMLLKDLLTVDLYCNGMFGEKFSDYNYGGQIRFGF